MTAPSEAAPPSQRQRWPRPTVHHPARRTYALIGLSLTSCTQVVDPSLNSAALTPAARGLAMGPAAVTTAASLSTLIFAASILGVGALGDLKGRRRVLLAGLAGTIGGGLLCATAQSPELFLAGRALTGVAIAASFAMSLAIIPLLYRGPELPKAFGVWLGVQGAAVVVGMLGGGALVTHAGWWAAYLVVPALALAAFAWSWFTVPDSRAEQARRFDTVGIALAAIALVCLVRGFGLANSSGITAPSTLGFFTAALAGLGAFAWWENRVAEPAFPMQLFKVRPFVAAMIAGVAFNFGTAAQSMQFPSILQQSFGASTMTASLCYAMSGLAGTFAAFSVSSAQSRYGLSDRGTFVSGLLVMVAGLGTMAFTTEATPLWVFLATACLIGFGYTWAPSPQASVMMRVAPPSMVGAVGAVKPAVGQVGFGLGLGGLIPVVTALTQASSGTARQAQVHGFALGMGTVALIVLAAAAVIAVMLRPRTERPTP